MVVTKHPCTGHAVECNTWPTASRPLARQNSDWPTAPCRRIIRAKAIYAGGGSGWTAWWFCQVSYAAPPQILACLWFLFGNRQGGKFRGRRGTPVHSRRQTEPHGESYPPRVDPQRPCLHLHDACHAWQDGTDAGEYAAALGFCKSATLEEVRKHSHVLLPDATSALGRSPKRASRAERRQPASPLNGRSRRPRPRSWMQR